MGIYTALKFKIKLNDFGKEIVFKLLDETGDKSWVNISNHPMIVKWSGYFRCDFIPFGYSGYDGWDHFNNFDGDFWEVSCDLKDYNDEIKFFWNNIIPLLSSEIIYGQTIIEELDYVTNLKKLCIE